MSYILEALKKAERDRAASKLPDLKTMVLAPRDSERTRSVLPYAAALGAVIVLSIGAGWWYFGKWAKTAKEKPPVVAAASAVSAVPAAPTPAPEVPAAPVVPPVPAAPATAPVPLAREPEVKPLQAVVNTPKTARPLAPLTKPVVNPKIEKPAADAAKTTPPSDKPVVKTQSLDLKMSTGLRVLAVSELPADIRKQLPKITAGGYVYSADAASRVVNINERSLREGDELVSGMRLDQIAQDHVVFSFRGYRFRVEMF